MTTLDTALSAALQAIAGDDEVGDEEMLRSLRAALGVIRKPDFDLLKKVDDDLRLSRAIALNEVQRAFTAYIDLILGEAKHSPEMDVTAEPRGGVHVKAARWELTGDITPDPRQWDLDGDHAAPLAFVQWKGTDVCLDFTCECGAEGHLDGFFADTVRCPGCGARWEMPALIFPRRAVGTRVGVTFESDDAP